MTEFWVQIFIAGITGVLIGMAIGIALRSDD